MSHCYICGDEGLRVSFVPRIGRFTCASCARATPGVKVGRTDFLNIAAREWKADIHDASLLNFYEDYMSSTECDVQKYLRSCSSEA